MYTALQATSLTLENLLRERFTTDAQLRPLFDPGSGGTMIISLNSPQEMKGLTANGVSVWLYQVARDPERLNMLPERIAPGQLRREPLPLRLHYMVTPVVDPPNGSSPQVEQMILGKVLQTFLDRPVLRGADLRGALTGTDAELTVRLENLTLEQVSQVFYSLERSLQLSVSYEVAVVYIESDLSPLDGQPVQVALPRYGVEVAGES